MSDWDLYFTTVVGWQMHPGYLREGAKPLSLSECAAVADEMLLLKEERPWLSGEL